MSDYVLPAGTAGHDEFEVDVSPQRAGWTYSGLRVATLAAGSSTTVETGEYEYLVLPLEGSWRVEVDGRTTELAGRRTIWGQVTDYFFLPRGTTAVVTAVSGGRVGLPYALASEDLEPRYCPVDEVTVELRGADYLCRQASSYSVGNALHTSRLLVVEVITPGGCWSSYPPHKHDEEGPDEHELEEIYYFQIKGNEYGPGMALHATYGTADRPISVAAKIGTGDVTLVPHGWHGPCAAAPGYDLYYLNVMAGPGGAEWKSVDDPEYTWLRGTYETGTMDPRLPYQVDENVDDIQADPKN